MAKAGPDITLALGNSGRLFKRWTTAALDMRIDAVAHGFKFEHVDARDPLRIGQAGDIADSINEGDRVRIMVNKKTEIDGFVDSVEIVDSLRTGPMVTVMGRSLTKDLIDCAALHKADPPPLALAEARALLVAIAPGSATNKAIRSLAYANRETEDLSGEWQDAFIVDIAQQICDPFGLTVALGDGALGPLQLAELSTRAAIVFRRMDIRPGEHAIDVIRRMADERGILLTCNADGQPALTIAGARKILGKLQRGVNIGDGASRRGDERDRFQTYRIFGSSAGDDAWHGENARGGDATATDDQVTRYRPFVATADGTSGDGDFVRRAEWERNRRAGRARSINLPILSWLDPEGNTWRPNRLIDVIQPVLRLNGELLIESVNLAYDIDKGDRGTLALVHPGAYDPVQKPKTKRNRQMWTAWS